MDTPVTKIILKKQLDPVSPTVESYHVHSEKEMNLEPKNKIFEVMAGLHLLLGSVQVLKSSISLTLHGFSKDKMQQGKAKYPAKCKGHANVNCSYWLMIIYSVLMLPLHKGFVLDSTALAQE